MKSITKHTGILEIIKRLPSSINGNPRFLVSVDGYTCKTSPDSSLGYSICNFDGKKVSCDIGLHYNQVTIENVKRVVEESKKVKLSSKYTEYWSWLNRV